MTLSYSCSVLDAWWEVNLEANVAVTKVTIYTRKNWGNGNMSMNPLSNSVVSLRNQLGTILYSYGIGDISQCPFIVVSVGKASTAGTPSTLLVWRVRVELDGQNYLNLSEVHVYDAYGFNYAKNKPATQSSTYKDYKDYPASNAVNGILTDFTNTNNDAGIYHTHERFTYANHVIQTT